MSLLLPGFLAGVVGLVRDLEQHVGVARLIEGTPAGEVAADERRQPLAQALALVAGADLKERLVQLHWGALVQVAAGDVAVHALGCRDVAPRFARHRPVRPDAGVSVVDAERVSPPRRAPDVHRTLGHAPALGAPA